MARTYKHQNSDNFYHAKRKARPNNIDKKKYCENCSCELFPEEEELGLCGSCIGNSEKMLGRSPEYMEYLMKIGMDGEEEK